MSIPRVRALCPVPCLLTKFPLAYISSYSLYDLSGGMYGIPCAVPYPPGVLYPLI